MTVTDLRDYPTPEQMADICQRTIRQLRELKPDIEHLGRHTVDLWRWCQANGYPEFCSQCAAARKPTTHRPSRRSGKTPHSSTTPGWSRGFSEFACSDWLFCR
jgi:hypothetical protein